MELDIIIVNWNSGHQLLKCINSIELFGRSYIRKTVVVDNSSTDGSADAIKDIQGIEIVLSKANIGFAKACNIGAKYSKSEYLLFLNPDTLLFENSLSVPLAYLEHPMNADIGICGIQLLDETGQISRSCARFPSLTMFISHILGLTRIPRLKSLSHHMLEWNHMITSDVDHVIGAFFFVRADLFRMLGGFDERYFVYLEDLDFSLRASQAGYRSVFLAEAQAFHAGAGTSRQIKDIRLFYSLRSRLLYGFKHFSRSDAILLFVLMMTIEPLSRLIFSFRQDGIAGVRNTLRAYKLLWYDLPDILKKGYPTI